MSRNCEKVTMFNKLICIVLLNILMTSEQIGAQMPGGCSDVYSDQSGTISSPNYPNAYANNLNCYYYIESSSLYSVNIVFTSFATELCCDWVQVSCDDGSEKASPKFYGKNLPPYLSIQCSRVVIQLYTDSSTTDTGFSLKYEIGEGTVGGLSVKPLNVFVDSDTTGNIVLGCTSNFERFNSYPWWSFSANGTSPKLITSSNCSLFTAATSTLYSPTRQSPPSACNLIISTFYLSSVVGVYTCTDSSLDEASAVVANLTRPKLSSFADLSVSTTEVVQDDTFNITCSTAAQQQLPPLKFQLRLHSSDQENLNVDVRSNTSVSLMVTAYPELLPSYMCDIFVTGFPTGYATNQPNNFSATLPGHQVLFWPEEESMMITGGNNGKLTMNSPMTCYAPSNPPAMYRWDVESSGSQDNGPTVYVSRSGTYTCTAKNFVRGKLYQASKSITITIDNQMNLLALIIGVVLGAGVLIPMMIVIVALVCLCRRNRSSKDADGPASQTTPSAPSEVSATNQSRVRNMYEMKDEGITRVDEYEAPIRGEENIFHDNTAGSYETLHVHKDEDSSEGVRV